MARRSATRNETVPLTTKAIPTAWLAHVRSFRAAAMAGFIVLASIGAAVVDVGAASAATSSNPTCGNLGSLHGCVAATRQGLSFTFSGYGAGNHSEETSYSNVSTGTRYNQLLNWSGDSTNPPIVEPLPAGEYKGSFTVCPTAGGGCDVVDFDLVTGTGTGCDQALPNGSVVGMAETADGNGYWIASSNGQVAACGDAPAFPSGAPGTTAIAAAPGGDGYWLVTGSGAVESYGSALYHGGIASTVHLNRPIVAMAADPATGGYWLLGGDGGVFSFDAPFYGSTGNIRLNQPAVGMEATLDGGGYRFVASDGGIFDFGSAVFYGSTGNIKLNKPVVGMANDPATGGYWLDASDGGIFSFHAPFYGSTGNITLAGPCVGMTPTPTGAGYRFVASDGGIFDFGDASFEGSAA